MVVAQFNNEDRRMKKVINVWAQRAYILHAYIHVFNRPITKHIHTYHTYLHTYLHDSPHPSGSRAHSTCTHTYMHTYIHTYMTVRVRQGHVRTAREVNITFKTTDLVSQNTCMYVYVCVYTCVCTHQMYVYAI
jgi:hypothetical protein